MIPLHLFVSHDESWAETVDVDLESRNGTEELVQSIQILQKIIDLGDPLSILNQYYQRKGFSSIAQYFSDPRRYRKSIDDPKTYASQVGDEESSFTETYWRCSFQCPIRNKLRIKASENPSDSKIKAFQVFSVAPKLLLLLSKLTNNILPNSNAQKLMRLWKEQFGDIELWRGQVFLGTKKNAKRSAAFAMLLYLLQENLLSDEDKNQSILPTEFQNLKKKKKKKKPTTTNANADNHQLAELSSPVIGQREAVEQQSQAIQPSQRTLNQIRGKTIYWVDSLHQYGVRKVQIRYEAVTPPHFTTWSGGSTLIFCELQVAEPRQHFVTGDPMPTKDLARDNAIFKLLRAFETSNNNAPVSKDPTLVQKVGLFKSDSPICDYRFYIPNWSCRDVILDALIQEPKMPLTHLMFELVISGSDSHCNEQYNHRTRIGLLLPYCNELNESPLNEIYAQSDFIFGEDGTFCKATLIRRESISIPSTFNRPTKANAASHSGKSREGRRLKKSDDRWELLFEFRKILNQWKKYGGLGLSQQCRQKHVDYSKNNMEMARDNEIIRMTKESIGSRKYTFVPLRVKGGSAPEEIKYKSVFPSSQFPCAASAVECPRPLSSSIEIDWDLIEEVVSHNTKPYLVMSRRYGAILYWGIFIFLNQAMIMLSRSQRIGEFFAIQSPDSNTFTYLHSIFLTVAVLVILTRLYFLPAYDYKIYGEIEGPRSLNNCFLQHEPRPCDLYIATGRKTSLNALSMLLSPMSRAKEKDTSSSLRKETKADFKERVFDRSKHFDRKTARFYDYFRFRYGLSLRHTLVPLIEATPVKKLSNFQWFQSKFKKDIQLPSKTFLIPELVRVLPMPCDFLFTVGLAMKYMPAIEREISNRVSTTNLKHMAERIGIELKPSLNEFEDASSKLRQKSHPESKLALEEQAPQVRLEKILSEATTLHPKKRYERLEFLGDKVLGFFVTINVFGRNFGLQWDHDDIGEICSNAGKNVVLFEGALRAGIDRLIHAGPIAWKLRKKDGSGNSQKASLSVSNRPGGLFPIANSTLSDVVESILSAAYLYERGIKGGAKRSVETSTRGSSFCVGNMVVAILELLQLPIHLDQTSCSNSFQNELHEITLGTKVVDSEPLTSPTHWFRAKGFCLEGGYPFQIDPAWHSQLLAIDEVLHSIPSLNSYLEILVGTLCSRLHMDKAQLHADGRLLLKVAVFDASLDGSDIFLSTILTPNPGAEEEIEIGNHKDEKCKNENDCFSDRGIGMLALLKKFYRMAIFRDTLFHIGNASLELALTLDLYQLYPDATPGDLHLIKTCCLSDDVLVYIFLKRQLHKCLADPSPAFREKLEQKMIQADGIGLKIWAQNGGWIIPSTASNVSRNIDGVVQDVVPSTVNTYARRRWNVLLKRSRKSNGLASASNLQKEVDDDEDIPHYPGLAGGRWHGCGGRKLGVHLTGDWQFSFKSIIGALVLSHGLDCAWYEWVRPLLEELMIVTPEEYRLYFQDVSSICKTYGPGNL